MLIESVVCKQLHGLITAVYLSLAASISFAQVPTPKETEPAPLPQAAPPNIFLKLTPDLSHATLDEGHGNIPFIVTNVSSEEVAFMEWNQIAIGLMTFDEAGEKVSIEKFLYKDRGFAGSAPDLIVLKPGETGTYNSGFGLETMAFAATKHKRIFGVIHGRTKYFTQSFSAHSESFPVPSKLAKPPWEDLGTQNYLKVTIDPTKPYVTIGCVMFPIQIENISSQTLAVNSEHVSFCRSRYDRGKAPDLWEVESPLRPILSDGKRLSEDLTILKPGESVEAGGRSYFQIGTWAPGDQLTVAVGGKILNTNKVFECYSKPFICPAIP